MNRPRLFRSSSKAPDDGEINVFAEPDERSYKSFTHPKVRQRSKSNIENRSTVLIHPSTQRSKSSGDVNSYSYNESIVLLWKSALFSKYEDKGGEAKSKLEAPDGGWGWFVLFSSFMIQFIVIGFDGSAGILYMNFRDKYQQSAAITAWLGSLATALRLTLGPLASGLSSKFSERYVIMISGAILSLSMILTGLSPNIIFVFLNYGILGGIGRSFAYCPAIVMLGIYFKKKQGLVTGIAASGCGLGRFVMALLVPVLFVYFEFLGAFMMMGGIALQIVVMGALMRPLRSNKNDTRKLSVAPPTVPRRLSHNDMPYSVHVTIPENKIVENFKVEKIPKDKITKEKAKLFNFVLLKDIRFLGFCIAMLLSSLAEQSAFVFLPAFAKEMGNIGSFSPEYTLAITSVFNTAAKIPAGFLFDCSFVRPYRVYLYNGLMFGLVIVSFCFPSVTNLVELAIACALYGICAGSYTAQKSVVAVDILGRDKLRHSYGILMMFQGIGVFIGPPLSGLFKDINGKYDVAFYLGGAGMLMGSTVLLICNIIHHIQSKKPKKLEDIRQKIVLPKEVNSEPKNKKKDVDNSKIKNRCV